MGDLMAPVLQGAALSIFTAVYERAGGILFGPLTRQNRVPQVLDDRSYPEAPM